MTDQQLLADFVDRKDEAAFAAIVERHLQIVYAAARRQVGSSGGNAHLAEDVAQAVFIMLATKAAKLRNSGCTSLAGWLVNAARLAAKAALRAELRRKRREDRVASMNRHDTHLDSGEAGVGAALAEEELSRGLDEALAQLGDADRSAITLRYLQEKSVRDVAEQMGTSEAAANKRILRALDKLRGVLARAGISLTPAVLADSLLRQAQVALPTSLSAPSAASTAIAAARDASVASAAAAIAADALGTIAWKGALAVVAALLLVGITIAASLSIFRGGPGSATPQAASVIKRPAGKINVGVLVSLQTATRNNTTDRRTWNQLRIVDELANATDLALFPLIEPGSESDPQLAHKLELYFPNKKPIDASDADAVATMDVVVACAACFAKDEVLVAFDKAVHQGTGIMVRQCLGGDDNGYRRPPVRHFRLLSDNFMPDAIISTKHDKDVVVLTSHPLLGTLSGHTDASFLAEPTGGYGMLVSNATPLLQMKRIDAAIFNNDKKPLEPHEGWGIYPLAVGQYGAGRVVSVGFDSGKLPEAFDRATNHQFSIHAVRWAAGREIEP